MNDKSKVVILWISYIFIGIFSLICLIPFWIMIVSSLTAESALAVNGYTMFPSKWSTLAYQMIGAQSDLLFGSYTLTVILTIVGTAIGLFLTAMTGYALQRSDYPYRNKILLYIYITTLFSGGLIPFYLLMTKYMGLKDNYLAILLPSLLSPWNIILMKNLMKSIPHSITESAKMDGAGDFKIFLALIIPMSTPALATLGLFIGLGYWNEWYNAMLFLSPSIRYRPLQLLLYNLVASTDYIKNTGAAAQIDIKDLPSESMKMAVAVMATGPVMLAFPLVQKHFIKGITIGAVKG